MRSQIMAVAWKEWHTLLSGKGHRLRLLLVLTGPFILAGYVSWDQGGAWGEGMASILLAVLTPAVMVIALVPDTFAGERERRTLETLFTEPVSDGALLIGKLIVPIIAGIGASVLALLVGMISSSLAGGAFKAYDESVLLLDLWASICASFAIGVLGTWVSLRSDSVQSASQLLMAVLLLAPLALGGTVLLLRRFLELSVPAFTVGRGFQIFGLVMAVAVFVLLITKSAVSKVRME